MSSDNPSPWSDPTGANPPSSYPAPGEAPQPPAPPPFPAPVEFPVGAATMPPPAPFAAPDASYTPAYQQTPIADPYAGSQPVSGYPGSPAYPPPAGQQVYPPPQSGAGYGGYGGYGAQPPVAYYPAAYVPKAKTNGLALTSMILGIVGVVMLICYGIGGLIGIVGAILGHVAKRQIRERQEGGDGMALAGIICGWIAAGISLLIIAGLILLFTVADTSGSSSSDFDDTFRFLLAKISLLGV